MQPCFSCLDTELKDLEPDDIAWASYRYQTDAYDETFGSISGRITYGDEGEGTLDDPHPAVAGALVLAVEATDSEEQVWIHAYTDANGEYTVPVQEGLGTGANEYWIYVQPLDGNVWGTSLKPGNISPYVYAHTNYTDFPEEFYDDSESAVDNPLQAAKIEITTVANVPPGPYNLITNRDEVHPVVRLITPEAETDEMDVNPLMMVHFS